MQTQTTPDGRVMCFQYKMWKPSLLPGAWLTQPARVSCLKAAVPNPSLSPRRYRDDVSIVVNPLTTWTAKQQCAPGHGCVSRRSAYSSSGQSFSAAVIGGAVRVQTAFAGKWIQRNWPSQCLQSLLKLDGNIRLLWFPWYNLASGSLLCLYESVTTLTCTKEMWL